MTAAQERVWSLWKTNTGLIILIQVCSWFLSFRVFTGFERCSLALAAAKREELENTSLKEKIKYEYATRAKNRRIKT